MLAVLVLGAAWWGVTVVSTLVLLLPVAGLVIFLALTQGVAALMGGAGAMRGCEG